MLYKQLYGVRELSRFKSAIAKFPRIELFHAPTVIERLSGVEKALRDVLNGVELYVKRDDVMGLGGGGNKLRKLEFLLGEAQTQNVDTIIAVGGRQTNHGRLTAAAAARLGLDCELVLTQVVPIVDEDYQQSGNILLDQLFGAKIHDLPGTAVALDHAKARAQELLEQGRVAYVMSSGGSSAIGCLGYANCAAEILDQSQAMGIEFDQVIVPNGSSGTHAGLAAGFAAMGKSASVVRSFSVLAMEDVSHKATLDKARETLGLLGGSESEITENDIIVDGAQRGDAYGIPTDAMREAVRLMARHQGLLLDPVYSGKAFAGLIADIRNGHYKSGQKILFIMTGGSPGLFAYRNVL